MRKPEIHVEPCGTQHVRHEHLIVVHPQRPGAPMGVNLGVHARACRHGGAQFDRRSGRVGKMQRTALVGNLDESRRNADAREVRFRLVEVFVGEHPKADAFALRLAGRPLEREAVVTMLLHSAQPDRVRILVAHDQAQHLGIEVAAGGEIARREHEMAGARDVEGRVEIGFRNGHCGILFRDMLIRPSRARRFPAPHRPIA